MKKHCKFLPSYVHMVISPTLMCRWNSRALCKMWHLTRWHIHSAFLVCYGKGMIIIESGHCWVWEYIHLHNYQESMPYCKVSCSYIYIYPLSLIIALLGFISLIYWKHLVWKRWFLISLETVSEEPSTLLRPYLFFSL
jgi:hypothetical protein